MKKFLCILLCLVGVRAETVFNTIIPTSTNATYAVTDNHYQKGGTITWLTSTNQLTNTTAATGIPMSRRQNGMIAAIGTNNFVLDSTLTNWTQIYIPSYIPLSFASSNYMVNAQQFVAAQKDMFPRPVMRFNNALKAAIDARSITIAAVGDSITAGASTPFPAGWFQNLIQQLRILLPGFTINAYDYGLGSRTWGQFLNPNYTATNGPIGNVDITYFFQVPADPFDRSEYWPGGTTNIGMSWQQYASNSTPDIIISSFQMNEAGLESSMSADINALSAMAQTWAKVPFIVLGNVQLSTADPALWPFATQNMQLDLSDMVRQATIRNNWGLIDQNKWYNMARYGSRTQTMPLVWEDNFLHITNTAGYWQTNGAGGFGVNGSTGITITNAQVYRSINARDFDLSGTFTFQDTNAIFATSYRQKVATNRTGGYTVQIGVNNPTNLYVDIYYQTTEFSHVNVPVADALGTNNFRIRNYGQVHETWLNGAKVMDVESNAGFLTAGFSLGAANAFGITITNAHLRWYGQTNFLSFYPESDLLGTTDGAYIWPASDPNVSGGGGVNHASTLGNYRFAIPAVTEFAKDLVAAIGVYQNQVGKVGSQSMDGPLSLTTGSLAINSNPSFVSQNAGLSIRRFDTNNSIAFIDLITATNNAFAPPYTNGIPANDQFIWRTQSSGNTYSLFGYLNGSLNLAPIQISSNGVVSIGATFSGLNSEVDFRQANVFIGDPIGSIAGSAFLNIVKPLASTAGLQFRSYDTGISALTTNEWRLQSSTASDLFSLLYFKDGSLLSTAFTVATNGPVTFGSNPIVPGLDAGAGAIGATTVNGTNVNTSTLTATSANLTTINAASGAITYGNGGGSPALTLKKSTAGTETLAFLDNNTFQWRFEYDPTQRILFRGYSNATLLGTGWFIDTNLVVTLGSGGATGVRTGSPFRWGSNGSIRTSLTTTNLTLSSGIGTNALSTITANAQIWPARRTLSGTVGTGGYNKSITAGSGFQIISVDTTGTTVTTDNSVIDVLIIEP